MHAEPLRPALEEEYTEEVDYFVELDTLDILEHNGASPALVHLWRKAIGAAEGIDIRWEK